MRKLCALLLVIVMALSVSVMTVAAKGPLEKGNAKGSGAKVVTTEIAENDSEASLPTKEQGKKQESLQKQFKAELNQQKKELQKEKSALSQQKEELEAQYEALIASGDTAGAEAVLASMNELTEQMKKIQAEIKQTINERYMVVKTMYSDTELAQFNSASELIDRMYADATVLGAGSVTANNNLIKFDAPAYLKGNVTLVPLRAISEELGAQVTWNEDTKTVTITKGETEVVITENSTTVLVNGSPVEISTPAEVTCGRTYLPLRFLAEALDFTVEWDSENQMIDIDDGGTTTTTEDTTSTEVPPTEVPPTAVPPTDSTGVTTSTGETNTDPAG